jgi:hypothetical protein
MAEDKIDDPNPPLARRAARPFVGPGGAAASARPLLRPTGPAGRSSPAPFAPPLAAPRHTLGRTVNERPAASVGDGGAGDAPLSGPVAPVAPVAPADPLELSELPSREPLSRRPITSEMVALDAFAAFDAVWGGPVTPAASPVVEPVAPPVDEVSLGSGAGAHELWAEGITEELDTSHAVEESAGLVAGAEHGVEPSDVLESARPTVTTPDSAVPAWLVDDSHWTDPSPPPQASTDLIVAAATDIPADRPDETVDARTAHGLRVAGALDRLAERVRGGEIDVSSVAPEAPDAAVLASVLAALLGGSSSR